MPQVRQPPLIQSNQIRQAQPSTGAPAYPSGPPEHPQTAGLVSAPIPRTKQFWISFRSKMDNQLYEGQFTTRKLSIRDVAAIGVRKAQLNGGYHYDENRPGLGIDEQTDWMNSMIAHLEISLIQAPIWFNLDEIMDAELLGAIFKHVMEFESSFFRSYGEDAAAPRGGENVGSTSSEGARAAGHVEEVGRGQVQNSLDP